MIRHLLAWRRAALLLVASVTVVLAWAALGLSIDPGVESMIPSGPGALGQLRAFQARFGSDEVVLLAVHDDQLFSADSLARLDALTRRVAALPGVARVLSPTNARDLEGDELGPAPVVPYDLVRAGRLTPEGLGQRLAGHPIFGGLLVGRDARTAALLVELAPSAGAARTRREAVAAIRRLGAGAGPWSATFVAGLPVEQADVAGYIARDQRIFVPLVFLILAAATTALYRHALGMLVPLTVVTLATVWTLGLFGLAGRTLNPVTSLMTPVILVMGLEGAVQLLNQYLAARARGLARPAALAEAHGRMGLPCFNAAVTAAVGFLSLAALPIPAIRDFGLFTALGVMVGVGLTVTLTPLLLASLPDFPPRVLQAFHPGPVEAALSRLVRRVCARPWPTALAVGAVLLLAAIGLLRLRVETDLIRSLRHASPLAAATRFVDAHLTGVNSVEILVAAPSAHDTDLLARLDRFETAVRALPGVRAVTGLPDLLARANRAAHQGDDTYARLPDGPDAALDVAEFVAALGREAPADLQRFLGEGPGSQATLRVIARVAAVDTASSQALFGAIRDAARRTGLPPPTLTGPFVVFSDMSTTLVRHQIEGLAVALVLVLTVMVVQLRSVRLGLLCAVPNVAPVLVVYGLMGWVGVALSVPTAMIASVSIGTIVDNSIYLLARFREAFRARADYADALVAMVRSAGRAVVFSTVALAAGFGVGAFSSFLPTVHFGLLTGAAFLLGLASQFVLLPLCLVLVRPLGDGPKGAGPSAAALVTAVMAIGLLGVGPAAAQEEAPREILLKDQYGRVDGPGRHRGQPVLLLYGRVEGLRRMKTWEEQVRQKVPGDLAVLRGLDGREARGRRTEAEVNERLQRNVPPSIAILIDWNGDLARAYRLPAGDVVTAVLDGRGQACLTEAGPVTPEALERVARALGQTRLTGVCP